MSTSTDALTRTPETTKLQRIRRISRPLSLLIWIALALLAVPVLEAGVLLLFHQIGSPVSYVSFTPWGVGVSIGHLDATEPALVPVADLSAAQRTVLAGLLILCTACNALMLLQLRGLFSLYSRGVVFAAENTRRIKHFALWLVAATVAINLSGRMFEAFIHTTLQSNSNAALIVVLGAMIYVIGYVMDLGREADLERKEFI